MRLKDDNKTERIYKATLKLVKETGLAGITMQTVAKEAKIATGTLYIYFNNKEALVVDLFKECVRNSAREFFKNYDAKASFKTGFHTIWSNIVHQRLSHFDESLFIEQCFHSPFIDENIKASVKKMFDPLRELMARGKKENLIKDIDTFWLLAFMIGYTNEMAKRIIYHKKKLNAEILELNFQMCWDGIKA